MLLAFFCATTLMLLAGFALANQIVAPAEKTATARRLHQVTRGSATTKIGPAGDFDFIAVLTSIAGIIRARTGLFVDEELDRRLVQAGHTSPLALDVYTAARLLLPLAAAAATVLLPEGFGVLGLLILPVPAFLAPEFVLRFQASARLARIRASLPDTLDLLVICVDAGLGLDQAVARVADELAETHPDIHTELLQVGREQRAGKPRQQAWGDLAQRLGLPEVEAFVGMILQADKFGTPIARALAGFSKNNRLQRTQAAEEQAAKAAAKITIPLVLFIFPSIFIVLLGPAVLTVLKTFKAQ